MEDLRNQCGIENWQRVLKISVVYLCSIRCWSAVKYIEYLRRNVLISSKYLF